MESSFYVDRDRCEVHGTPTIWAIVPIEYGYLDFDPEFLTDRPRLFPNAEDVVGGGCVVEPETHARVRYCPRCRAAKKAWLSAHPGVRGLGDRDLD